jgi:hypothetical protein
VVHVSTRDTVLRHCALLLAFRLSRGGACGVYVVLYCVYVCVCMFMEMLCMVCMYSVQLDRACTSVSACCIFLHSSTHTHTHIHTHTHTHIYTHTYTYTYAYTYTYIYTYIHIRKQLSFSTAAVLDTHLAASG